MGYDFEQTPPETVLWRYLDLPKFLDLVVCGRMFFTNPSYFEDPDECSLPEAILNEFDKARFQADEAKKNNLDYNARAIESFKYTPVTCYCRSVRESVAHWKLFGGQIAYQTTPQLIEASMSLESGESLLIGNIRYIDYRRDSFSWGNAQNRVFHKRIEYQWEQEVRVALLGQHILGPGVTRDIDAGRLIKKVVVSQSADCAVEAITRILTRYLPGVQIQRSDLGERPKQLLESKMVELIGSQEQLNMIPSRSFLPPQSSAEPVQ